MSKAANLDPVLLIGYGPVGSAGARALRRLHPDLPLVIGGRTLPKAQALADELGNASAIHVDISVPGLGLPKGLRFSFVFPMVKDRTLNVLAYAEEQGAPYAAFSEFVYEYAPFIARQAHKPDRSAVLMLGHLHGGSIPVAALEFAKSFRSVSEIVIGMIFDPVDFQGGNSAGSDMTTGSFGVPAYLVMEDRKWRWIRNGTERRTVRSVDGRVLPAQGFAIPDVITFANELSAKTARVDFAFGNTARSHRGEGISHEIFIDIMGVRHDGTIGHDRYEMVDHAGYAPMSARGAVFCIERMLGLVGGDPVPPGLYNPENFLDPAHVVERLKLFGTQIRKV